MRAVSKGFRLKQVENKGNTLKFTQELLLVAWHLCV